MIQKIYILNGPNLNLIGFRQPEIYGSVPMDAFILELKAQYAQVRIEYFQTNHEGALIDFLHAHGFEQYVGFLLNAGGLSHTSISLRDAVTSIEAPVVEIHISDISQRESFRHHSYLTAVCVAHFIGQGMNGYAKGIEYFLNR